MKTRKFASEIHWPLSWEANNFQYRRPTNFWTKIKVRYVFKLKKQGGFFGLKWKRNQHIWKLIYILRSFYAIKFEFFFFWPRFFFMIWTMLETMAKIEKHFRLFFGSNGNFKICFLNLLTFSIIKKPQFYKFYKNKTKTIAIL